jgi:hypothetical protein
MMTPLDEQDDVTIFLDRIKVKAHDAGAGRGSSLTHTAFAISRSLNFWILPVDVFGISAKTT